jgi:AcrR family transcriptional regulator
VLLVVPVNLRDVAVTGSRQVQQDGRRERWRAHRAVRREELIAAVVDAVSVSGASIGMDDISAASGIAKPVFYRYFADKSDLFLAVGRSVAETVVADTTDAIDAATSPRAKLEAGIGAYISSIEANPELYRFVTAHRVAGRTSGTDLVSDYADIVGLHASVVIGEFMRAAGLDSGAADPWGFGIVGLVRAATDRWLEQRTMTRAALVTYLTDLIWPGLSGSVSGSAPGSRPLSA